MISVAWHVNGPFCGFSGCDLKHAFISSMQIFLSKLSKKRFLIYQVNGGVENELSKKK